KGLAPASAGKAPTPANAGKAPTPRSVGKANALILAPAWKANFGPEAIPEVITHPTTAATTGLTGAGMVAAAGTAIVAGTVVRAIATATQCTTTALQTKATPTAIPMIAGMVVAAADDFLVAVAEAITPTAVTGAVVAMADATEATTALPAMEA